MKKRFLVALLALAALPATAQITLPRPSPNGMVMQTLGLTDVTVTYSRPGVKGRPIWGELVPYDKVWRTGANEPTKVKLGGDVMVEGKKLAAGTYGLYTIPGKSEWTVAYSSDTETVEPPAAKDVLRVTVKPTAAPASTEWMTFVFEDLSPAPMPGSGTLVLYWEKLRVPVRMETDVNAQVMTKAKEQLDDWRPYLQAANYLVNQKTNLDDAARWIDRSISIKETYANVSAKARLQAAQGKTAEAVKTGERALEVAKTAEPKPNEAQLTAFTKQVQDWKAGKK
jgi:hypothetical protein